jgi:hypothetical protein
VQLDQPLGCRPAKPSRNRKALPKKLYLRQSLRSQNLYPHQFMLKCNELGNDIKKYQKNNMKYYSQEDMMLEMQHLILYAIMVFKCSILSSLLGVQLHLILKFITSKSKVHFITLPARINVILNSA